MVAEAAWPGVAHRIFRRPLARISLVILVLFAAVALAGEGYAAWARRADVTPVFNRGNLEEAYRPPGTEGHPLGTDGLGRDVAARLAHGAVVAFRVGLLTSAIAIPIGVLLGMLAGYFGGRVDDAVVWLYTTFAAIPGLLLALAIAMVVGKGLAGVCLGIGLTTWVGLCRLIRGEVMRQRDLPHVVAARALGAGHGRILLRHILPNIMHLVIVTFTLRFPASIGTEVFMSFLGIGVQGEPSWGTMLNSARLRLWQGAWWEMASVTAAIFLLVLAFNLLGDILRDELDPRTRGTGR